MNGTIELNFKNGLHDDAGALFASARRIKKLSELAHLYTTLVSDVSWSGNRVTIEITAEGMQRLKRHLSDRIIASNNSEKVEHAFWVDSVSTAPLNKPALDVFNLMKKSPDLFTFEASGKTHWRFGLTAKGLNLFYAYLMDRKAAFEAEDEESCVACTI